MAENEIMVSVSMLTYNHAKYIRKAVDSILMQKVNFKYEIVIGDDCSQDGTQDILSSYAQKFPDKFVLILRDHNIGTTHNNFDIIHHCRGKYIAFLEGDDYWTDENKLQIQVDFLETNMNCDAVAHRHKIVNENDELKYFSHEGMELDRYFTKEDALKYGTRLFHPNTLLYRNFYRGCVDNYTILRDSNKYGGHSLLIYLLASRTDIFIMSSCMSVWRMVVSESAQNYSSFAAKHPLLVNNNKFIMYINLRNYFGSTYDFSDYIIDSFINTLIRLIFSSEQGKLKEASGLYALMKDDEKNRVWFRIGPNLVRYAVTRISRVFSKNN